MINALPRWVEMGALFLAALAGMVNAVGLLGFQHQAVSHLSGTATLLGTALLQPGQETLHLILVLASFVAGAALSGLMIGNAALKLGRNYGLALLLEALLLLAALFALQAGSWHGHYLASAACGLQNALVTTFSGAIIRTTHVTGIFTDLGVMIGEMLRGQGFDRRKALLFLLIIAGFVCGGSLGSLLYPQLGYATLAVPAGMAMVLGLSYLVMTRARRS
ncbi:MAG: YoaK family protein [Alcanivoracaceae bacterium]|jgi:uncharacterized membrane protein YoaK (UPF0700 family)|nr:YoaK family protein [Alcanivoracaceae bacterium]